MSKSMRQDIEAVKSTLAAHTEMFDARGRRLDSIDRKLHNVIVEQARARGDIEWLKGNTITRDEYKAGLDQLLGRLDGIAGKIEDSRYDNAKNLNRLDEHERRIRALETKPS